MAWKVDHSPTRESRVLDLSCGSGVPVMRKLAIRGHDVVGIEGSARQLSLARLNVSNGHFIHADMTRVELAPSSFDAVAAFYSTTHVPRDEHAHLLRADRELAEAGGSFPGQPRGGPIGRLEGLLVRSGNVLEPLWC
jgi:SAM-dependent methyltransferase